MSALDARHHINIVIPCPCQRSIVNTTMRFLICGRVQRAVRFHKSVAPSSPSPSHTTARHVSRMFSARLPHVFPPGSPSLLDVFHKFCGKFLNVATIGNLRCQDSYKHCSCACVSASSTNILVEFFSLELDVLSAAPVIIVISIARSVPCTLLADEICQSAKSLPVLHLYQFGRGHVASPVVVHRHGLEVEVGAGA